MRTPLLSCAGLLGLAPAWAAAEPLRSGPVPLASGTLLQMLLGLALILALIGGAAWLARRHLPLRGAAGAISLRAGLALGARERVVLVEVDGVRLLLGVAPGRVQTLYVFDRDAQADFAAELAAAGDEGTSR